MTRAEIIKMMDGYEGKLQPSTIGQYAIQNRHFYEKLKSGSVSVKATERVVQWMKDNPPENFTRGRA